MYVRDGFDFADPLPEFGLDVMGLGQGEVTVHLGVELHLDDVAGVVGDEVVDAPDLGMRADRKD